VAAIALDEYATGVVDGRVVSEEEVREAQLFLVEARRVASSLPEDVSGRVLPLLSRLSAGITALEQLAPLRDQLEMLRGTLETTLDVTLDPLPSKAPSLVRGGEIYGRHCAQCHGVRGRGDGALAPTLDPPPPDLADQDALGGSSPVDFFRKVNVGVAGTAMPSFSDELGLDDRWAVALYASLLRFDAAERDYGSRLVAERCPDCRIEFSDFSHSAFVSDDSLARFFASGPGAPTDASVASMVAFARGAGAREELGDDRALAAARVVRSAKSRVAEAMETAASGDREEAAGRALDAYLAFEGIEGAVRARDGRVARRVEQSFTQFRGSLLASGAWTAVEAARIDVESSLDEALATLTVRNTPIVLLGQSFIILVREGMEAILLIGALMAFLVRAGVPERRTDIGWGVVAALVASGATAIGFATLFRSATSHQETLEGVTMLVAAAALFWVSYWLLSKIEMQKWQAFVRSTMEKALSSRNAFALSGVAFLAVYREGFETVLFYAALFASAEEMVAATVAIGGGIVAGLAVLGVMYALMLRYSVRIPLKPFFAVTSALLFIMAFSFAGQGVAELQEAGLVSVTPLEWVPAVPLLGVFPTIQTLLIQLQVAAALLAAVVWAFWLQPRLARARRS
jgi:high-affinity iron transporter